MKSILKSKHNMFLSCTSILYKHTKLLPRTVCEQYKIPRHKCNIYYNIYYFKWFIYQEHDVLENRTEENKCTNAMVLLIWTTHRKISQIAWHCIKSLANKTKLQIWILYSLATNVWQAHKITISNVESAKKHDSSIEFWERKMWRMIYLSSKTEDGPKRRYSRQTAGWGRATVGAAVA